MVEADPIWATLMGDVVVLLPALAANPFTSVQTVLLVLLTGAAMAGGG